MIHAHWFVAAAQLVVGILWSMVMWATGLRKAPNLSASDIASCIPIGLCACLAHAGSVLASAVGAVSFAQIVKAWYVRIEPLRFLTIVKLHSVCVCLTRYRRFACSEPVFAAVVGLLIPPIDVKPMLAYAMLVPIVGGVGLAW